MCLCKELICGNSTLQYLLYSVQLASADQHQVISEVPLSVAVRNASDLYQGPKVTLVVGQGVVGRDDQGSKVTLASSLDREMGLQRSHGQRSQGSWATEVKVRANGSNRTDKWAYGQKVTSKTYLPFFSFFNRTFLYLVEYTTVYFFPGLEKTRVFKKKKLNSWFV